MLTIPLSPAQQAYFADLLAAEQRIVAQRNTAVTVLIAGQVDPASVAGHTITVGVDAIVCYPPA